MSKGHGWLQREILEIVQEYDRPIPTRVLSLMVQGTKEQQAKLMAMPLDVLLMAIASAQMPQAEAKRVSVSRACHALWREGHLQKRRHTQIGSCWSLQA